MFKKLIALMVVMMMVFSVMTACTNDDGNTDNPENQDDLNNSDSVTDDNTTNQDQSNTDGKYKDGTYRAEEEDYDSDGYMDYVEVVIKDGAIDSVIYESVDKDGNKREEQNNTNNNTNGSDNQNTITSIYGGYADSLLENQDIGLVEKIEGGEDNYNVFIELSTKALDQAKTGNTETVKVPTK